MSKKLTPEKRKRIEELVYGVLARLDISGYNLELYKKKFKDDAELEKFLKWLDKDYDNNFYLHTTPYSEKGEPKLKHIQNAAEFLETPLREHIWFPHLNPEGEPVRSKNKAVVGEIHIKRPQQYEKKKNKLATDISKRDHRTGTVTGESKGTKFSNVDAFAVFAVGNEDVAKELLGFRADNMFTKNQAYDMIRKTGMLDLEDLEDDVIHHTALTTYFWYMFGAMYMTDLLGGGDLLPHKDITRYKKYIDQG